MSKPQTFYFDTGVKPCGHTPPLHLPEKACWRGGTMQFAFQCHNVPERASLAFLCDNPESKEGYLVRELLPGSGMISKYAHFKIP